MSMTIETKTVAGTKGKTLVYEVANFRYDEESHSVRWDAFPFYTPQGTAVDGSGAHYVEIAADEIPIIRDDTLDKIGQIVISVSAGLEYTEIIDGQEWPVHEFALDGDIAATIFIPADTGQGLTCQLKRVVSET